MKPHGEPMSEDFHDSHQDYGSDTLGDCPITCYDCGNYDEFEEEQGKWACLACGFLNKGIFGTDEDPPDNKGNFIPNHEQDPYWQKSTFVFVPSLKKRPYALSKTLKMKPGWQNRENFSQEVSRDFSIESEQLRQAFACLGMNPRRSVPNRSQWYEPFYEVPFDGIDSEMIKNSDTILPGPVYQLLNGGHLPPRRYWILPFDPEKEPQRAADWIRPDIRIPFEMYLHLNRKLRRPWPLSKWINQVNIRNRIGDILAKGGALSRKCEGWLGEPEIGETEVRNYLLNLNITNEFSSPNTDMYVSEAMRIINQMREKNYLKKFLDKLCILVQPNQEPAEFWIFGPDYNRKDVGHIHSLSIVVGLAVHTAIKQFGQQNPGALLDIALADQEFTNGTNIETRWGAILSNLDL